jgi:acetyl esterase/lipase
MGDKSMGLREIAGLVASGHYAGASINYRLSGEAVWPAQIHDCKAAVRWIRGNAAKYHLDPERLGAIGSSAGGHLAAMLGTSGDVPELEGSIGPHLQSSSRVIAVVDQFGPAELLAMAEHQQGRTANDPSSPESLLIGGPLQENPEKARAASPLTYVSTDDPPFLILHGTEDPLVPFDQSERLSRALKAAHVDVTFIPITGAGHGGFSNPEVARRIQQFFDKHLRHVRDITISSNPIPNQSGK